MLVPRPGLVTLIEHHQTPMNTELNAILVTAGLNTRFTTAEAENTYAFCLAAAHGDKARAKDYFLEIVSDRSYEAAVEASRLRLLNI